MTRALQKVVGEAEGHHVKALRGALADAQQRWPGKAPTATGRVSLNIRTRCLVSPSILAWSIAPQVLATETATQHYVKDRDVRWTDPWDGAVTQSAAGQEPLFELGAAPLEGRLGVADRDREQGVGAPGVMGAG